MKLVYNWPDILKRAWSIRFGILAVVLSGIEVFLSLIGKSGGYFATASGIVSALALWARIVAQKNLPEG